jgi:hypothetical protein
MHIPMLILLMLVLPLSSIVVENVMAGTSLTIALVGKWFVFWAVGIRLLAAGLRQIVRPSYTASAILGIESEESHLLVRELGFATTAIGCGGAASLAAPGWILPIALVGTIFYALAGINHAMHGNRNKLQNAAMVSDILIALVLGAFCVASMRWPI